MKKIAIIGSANTDLIVRTERIPRPGETLLGSDFQTVSGGKGANQAVTVARLGGDALFVARIGTDLFGEELLRRYRAEGLDTDHIIRDDQAPTGVAFISIDAAAENCIVVSPGANASLSKSDIDRAKPDLARAAYLLIQLEIPLETVEHAIRTAAEMGVKVILNPAPAARISDDTLRYVDTITPNETECALLTGIEIRDEKDARAAGEMLLRKGIGNVIITRGARGSVWMNADRFDTIPALRVTAVDTTAAGDVFNGALATALAEGRALPEAVRFATAAAALSVTRLGAQSSIPARDEVDELLGTNDSLF